MSATVAVLGATGDLTARLLMPAMVGLFRRSRLDDVDIVGYGLEDWTTERFVAHLSDRLTESGLDLPEGLSAHVTYRSGRLSPDDLGSLAADLGDPTVFYLALPPRLFADAAQAIAGAGLTTGGTRRLVVEKPFGTDGTTARELDAALHECWGEDQIFRIDHFLGKETVQNLATMRFANRLLDPILTAEHVDHVQITVAETLGLEGRYRYYDGIGALRDMIQNHLMQLFCYAAMEPPAVWEPEVLRDHKVELLRAVRVPVGRPGGWSARGQYGPGAIGVHPVPGYRDEPHVSPGSTTDTFAAVRFDVATWRWQGVPFYLRSGKRLGRDVAEIAYRFRHPPTELFASSGRDRSNWLVFRLDRPQGIDLVLQAKVPDLELATEPTRLHADYGRGPDEPTAYEQLLLDALAGDHTSFLRFDEVQLAWELLDPVLDAWTSGEPDLYASGSDGPASQFRILQHREHQWRPITLPARADGDDADT